MKALKIGVVGAGLTGRASLTEHLAPMLLDRPAMRWIDVNNERFRVAEGSRSGKDVQICASTGSAWETKAACQGALADADLVLCVIATPFDPQGTVGYTNEVQRQRATAAELLEVAGLIGAGPTIVPWIVLNNRSDFGFISASLVHPALESLRRFEVNGRSAETLLPLAHELASWIDAT